MTANGLTSGGWVVPGLAVGDPASLDTPIRPLDDLAAQDLGWLTQYVRPLQDVADRMTGDASVVETFTTAWAKTATAIDTASERLGSAAGGETAQWQGEAADSYRRGVTDRLTSLGDTAAVAADLAATSKTMAGVLAGARRSVGDLLTDLVGRLTSSVPQAVAAEGGVTANVLTQATDLIGKYATPIAAVERGVDTTIAQVVPLLLALVPGTGQSRGAAPPPSDDDLLILAAAPDAGPVARPPAPTQPRDPTIPTWELLGPDAASHLLEHYSDYYDSMTVDTQAQLRKALQDNTPPLPGALPLSDANTEAALRQGPNGTMPTVGTHDNDVAVAFRNSYVEHAKLLRDVITIDPAGTGVDDPWPDLYTAAEKLRLTPALASAPRELWVQVPAGTTSESLYGLTQRVGATWYYPGIDVHFRDPSGQTLGVVKRMR
ncbi:MAG: hypothetical protein ABWY11_20280 [Umezawaea sp.]